MPLYPNDYEDQTARRLQKIVQQPRAVESGQAIREGAAAREPVNISARPQPQQTLREAITNREPVRLPRIDGEPYRDPRSVLPRPVTNAAYRAGQTVGRAVDSLPKTPYEAGQAVARTVRGAGANVLPVVGTAAGAAAPFVQDWQQFGDSGLTNAQKAKLAAVDTAKAIGGLTVGAAGAGIGGALANVPGAVVGGAGGYLLGSKGVEGALGDARRGVNAAIEYFGGPKNYITSTEEDQAAVQQGAQAQRFPPLQQRPSIADVRDTARFPVAAPPAAQKKSIEAPTPAIPKAARKAVKPEQQKISAAPAQAQIDQGPEPHVVYTNSYNVGNMPGSGVVLVRPGERYSPTGRIAVPMDLPEAEVPAYQAALRQQVIDAANPVNADLRSKVAQIEALGGQRLLEQALQNQGNAAVAGINVGPQYKGIEQRAEEAKRPVVVPGGTEPYVDPLTGLVSGTRTVPSSVYDYTTNEFRQPPLPIPAAAIQYLKANPNSAPDFDAKYGVGAAARYLGR